jgi:hypothetical protein
MRFKMKIRREILAICAIFVALAATNRWPGWDEGIRLLSLSDVKETYQVIAESFPNWPSSAVPFHKAQRFVFPYLLGAIAKSGLSVPLLFSLFTMMCIVLILWAMQRSLRLGGVPTRVRIGALLFFCLQPYSLRYYGLAPGMGLDLAFVAGIALIGAGLLGSNTIILLLGGALAAVSRQTTLLLIPGVLCFLFFSPEWRVRKLRLRIACASVFVCLVTAIYVWTARIGAAFALPNTNLAVIMGIFDPLQTENITMFFEHIMRCFLPLTAVILAILLCRPSWRDARVMAFLLMGAAVLAQPFMAGPGITGQNGARLATMALLPFIFAWALAKKEDLSEREVLGLAAALFFGSFHHIYTWIGPSGTLGSAALQAIAAVGCVATLVRRNPQRL